MARTTRSEASLRGYPNGIADLASAWSEWIGRSSITVYVYTPAEFLERFQKEYRIRKPVTLVESSESFKQTLVQWLGATPYHLCDRVVGIFEYELGKAKRVLRAADGETLIDDLSASERGFDAYYFTEGVFFVEFETIVAAFILGNDE